MNEYPIRVIKVGGSLFQFPDLPTRLSKWLAKQAPSKDLIIPGGGILVDALRNLNHARSIDDEIAHWEAIRLMDMLGRILNHWLPEIPIISNPHAFMSGSPYTGPAILDCLPFLQEQEPRLPGENLQHHWDVTSDSISARVASVLSAQELVLLKSCEAPKPPTIKQCIANGYVDPDFMKFAKGIPKVRFENLMK